MLIKQEDFANQTINYFENVNYIIRDAINEKKESRLFEGREEFSELLDKIFELLLGESLNLFRDAIYNALRAVQEEIQSFERKDAFDLLYYELKYFNFRYGYEKEMPRFGKIGTVEKLEGAGVVLDSVQELINKLPKWVQKILKVISEALGLAKTFMGGV